MKLRNAAKYFDDDYIVDGYTGAYVFHAQWSNYDGANSFGSFERRRTVSVAPGTVPAPRRVVSIGGDLWIMGELVTDTFKDRPIRLTSSAKKVTDDYMLLTPGQAALRQTTGTALYGHTKYLKDTVNSVTDSDYTPFYDVALAGTEPVRDGMFLRSADKLLHIRSAYKELEGFWNAASDEVATNYEGAPVSPAEVNVVFEGVRNPITEIPAAGVSTTGIMLDMYMLYAYQTQADSLNRQGDVSLVVAKSAVTPLAGQLATVNGENWRVFRFTPYQDAWNLHLRRA